MDEFATDKYPLRASRLARFMQCPWSEVMLHLSLVRDDDSGSAADTGTAVHFAAHLWHTHLKQDTRLAVAAMRMALERFPLADLDSAECQFQWYTKDPRNTGAVLVGCEVPVEVRLPPAEGDPTGAEVVILGTVDQIRREPGGLRVVDIKTGGVHEGMEMLDVHCLQLAVYQLGASAKLGEPVQNASILRTKDYMKTDRQRRPKHGQVFWQAPWSLADCRELMVSVTHAVAEVRRGTARNAPGTHCRYCPAGNVASCSRELANLRAS